MSQLARYLVRQSLPAVALASILLAGLVMGLQLVRMGQYLLRAQLGWGETASLALCCLPTVVLFVLPLALAAGLLWALLRLGARGELEGMRAAGARPIQLATAPFALILAVGGVGSAVAGVVQPHALAQLRVQLEHLAARAVALDATRGGLVPMGAHAVFRAQHPSHRCPPGATCATGFLAALDAPAELITARRVVARPLDNGRLRLTLFGGELVITPLHAKTVHRLRFGRFAQEIDVRPYLARHFAFLADYAEAHRAVDAFIACVTLGLAALLIGLGVSHAARALSYASAALVAQLALAQGSRALWPTLPQGLCGLLLVLCGAAALARRKRRRATSARRPTAISTGSAAEDDDESGAQPLGVESIRCK